MMWQVDRKYQTKYGELTYTGLYKKAGFPCNKCWKIRQSIHEFIKGDYPTHTEVYHYGTECVQKFWEKITLEK